MTHSQLARFVRLFLMAFLPGLTAAAAGGSPLTVAVIATVAVAALETTWREFAPSVPASSATPPAKKAA